jgi:hypothetical protein
VALNARFPMNRPQAPLVAQGGIASKDWYVWLYNVYLAVTEGLPQPEEAITLSASPFSYQAVIRGQAHISGGTVSAVEFSRDGTTWYNAGITAGFVEMDARDQLRVTYSVLPTIVFFPM